MYPQMFVKEVVKRIPSCQSCIYFIKNKNHLLSQCKVFDDLPFDKKSKKALAIACRINENLCGINGHFYECKT
jgi:hypothetical protein